MQFEISLSPLQQKAIAVGLALVPLLGILALLGTFVTAQIERHTQASLLVRELARERAVLAQASDWHEHLSHVRSSSDWQGLFVAKLPSGQPGAAAAMITSIGGTVQQSSVRQLDSSGAREVDEHVVFTADTEQLSRILVALRGRRPVFVVRAISIQSQERSVPSPRFVPNTLHIEMTVAEFERPS